MFFFRPVLELTVLLPGMLLAYLPVKTYLKLTPLKLTCWMLPLLTGICISGGLLCYFLQISTKFVLPFMLLVALLLYHNTLRISLWKSGSIFFAVCAVFACINSFSRAIDAIIIADQTISSQTLWFHTKTCILYNLICLSFVLAAWFPASHTAKKLVEDENFAQTWYIFWILPLLFIGLNLFIAPKYRNTLYTGRILKIYIVMSLVLLLILILFYAMFLLMANSLNRNVRLQQENHLLTLQQTRYENLCNAIEGARQARHDIRHQYLQLSSLAEQGDLEKIKDYISSAVSKIPSQDLHFCENQATDSIVGYYSALAARDQIPFLSRLDLPAQMSIDEMDLCIILSNLLENAIEASLKTDPARRAISVTAYLHHNHLLLLHVENAYDTQISEKNHIFQSSKRCGNGVGVQSVRHIAQKNGGDSDFSYENGIFTANIMLRLKPAEMQ